MTATVISRFALAVPPGPYEKRPLRCCLLEDGAPTRAMLPGYVLLHQFELSEGYLFITDFDCPHEEATVFSLASPTLRDIESATLGGAYVTFLLRDVEWLEEDRLHAVFCDDDRWELLIRPKRFLRPRLRLRRVSK